MIMQKKYGILIYTVINKNIGFIRKIKNGERKNKLEEYSRNKI